MADQARLVRDQEMEFAVGYRTDLAIALALACQVAARTDLVAFADASAEAASFASAQSKAAAGEEFLKA